MPRKRRAVRGYRRPGPPPLSQSQELDLILGAAHGAFLSDREREQAWFWHRDRLMTLVNPLTRPQAWWAFECPVAKLPGEKDFHALERLGLLSESEKAQLAAWRRKGGVYAA